MPETSAEIARSSRAALDEQIVGQHLPFLVRRQGTGEAVGTTRYAHIDRWNRTTEIGWTFYGGSARRTAGETGCKVLLLRHAFGLGAIRGWVQTDKLNKRAQNAIARLGAKRGAELPNQRIPPGGRVRP